MNKELGKRIVAYLQRQGRPAKTVDIAKAVGCKTAKEINPTLYAMKRKDIVVKVTESPPTWSVSTEIPHDFLQDEASDFRPNVFTQSQQNYAIAAPVQYPTDGSILAFQETSLFNSDVSFETDYSDLLTGDDNLNSTGGDPLLTGHQSLVSNDAFNIAASDPLNLSRGLFDEDPQNDIAEDDPQNTNRAFISKDTQNDSSSQEFDNGESDSDKLFEDKGEKPSAFRSFFKLDESLSEESGEGDMNENVSDNDNNVDETNDEIGDSIDQSNDGPNEFSESNIMLELHGEHCEMFKDNERNGMNEMGAAQLDDDVTTEKADMDLSPPVLDKQEMNVSEQFHENRNTKEDAVERNSNETEVVFPNELTEELPIGTEEIAPNELPDQLPLDEDSDGSDDAMDRDIDHKNVNVQESLNGKQVEINTVMEDDELNRMPDVASKGQSQFSSGYSCMKVIKTSAVESQSQFYSGDSSMNVIKTSGMQESSLQASHALNVHMTDDENKNNNSIPCEESLSDDCQQLLNAFNPNMPCAQFVLKNKSKLSPDKLTECLQELKEHNLAEQNGNQWQLTESGKMQYRSMSGTGSSLAEHAMPLPRKRPHSSGPPPSPMALVQKERGIEPETSKESPLSFLRGAPKVDPFKHAVDLVHNRVSSSGDSGSHSNVEHLNSDLFPGARTLTSSSYAPISTSPFNRPTQSTVTSAFASGPAYAPVPLMSLNLDNSRQSQTSRTSISNFSSARQQSETNAFSDRTSGSSLFEQESRPSLNQSSGTSLFQQESRPSLNQSSGTSLFQQESRPSLNQSSGTSLFQQESRPSLNQTSGSSLFQQGTVPSFNQSSSSLIRPSNESVNSLFKPPVSSVSASVRSTSSSLSSTSRLSVTQTSSPMAPPATKPKARSDRVVIPKPPPRPGAVASGPSASSQKPPMSPAEMLARGLKKTDISPPKTMDSSPVSMLSSSHSVQLNTSQRSIAGNQSMFKPPAGPQSLLTGNQAGNQFSRGSFQSSGNQSGMLSSNQTGIGNQSGMLSSNQTGIGSSQTGIGSSQTGIGSSQTGIRSLMSQPQSLLSQGGYKPQTLSQGQFGFSSSGTQSQGLGSIGSGFKPLSQLQTSSSAGQFSSLSSSQRQFGSLSGQQSQTAPAVTAAPQPQTTNQSLSLDTESFAALNKNPVSALMEYAQSRKMEARIELIGRRGASHRPV